MGRDATVESSRAETDLRAPRPTAISSRPRRSSAASATARRPMPSSCAGRSSARRASWSSFSNGWRRERGTHFDDRARPTPKAPGSAPASRCSISPGSLFHLVDLETVLSAEARAGLRRRLQRLRDVRRPAEGRLSRDGCAPLRRRRDGRDDGLCRLGRLGRSRRKVAGAVGFVGNADRRDGALLRPRQGARHDAARADRLCRLDGARGRDVPRDLSRRAADRAGRLFRPRDQRRARGLPALSRAGRGRPPLASASTPMAAAIARGSTSPRSYEVLERHAPQAIRGYRTEAELRYLVGTGVSAAAFWHLRQALERGRLSPTSRSSPARASARPNAA